MPTSFAHELPPVIDRLIDHALEEDLASGDLTTEACIDPTARAVAYAVARKELVVCGSSVFARVFHRVDTALEISFERAEGHTVPAGTRLVRVSGRARSILMAERTALNFIQRMSGIATLTHSYVRAVPVGCPTRITDTRKTTPGLRVLERYAVRVGGGRNHRDNLGAAVLIKDNHIVACGGLAHAVERARKCSPHTAKIECEIDSLDQIDDALNAGADILLLDNMDTAEVIEAVRRVDRRAIVEASGGITHERIGELARAGVDAISVGALTHSAPAADIALDFTSSPDEAAGAGRSDVSKVSLRA